MMAPVDDALAQVAVLSAQLQERRADIQSNIDAYMGKQNLQFASPEFGAYFAQRFAGFSDNWCAPVIQATTERMNYVAIELGTERRADPLLQRAWKENDCERYSSEAFILMLTAARSFAMVWGNPDNEDIPRITWEHPENVIIGYDPDTGQAVAMLKLWQDDRYE